MNRITRWYWISMLIYTIIMVILYNVIRPESGLRNYLAVILIGGYLLGTGSYIIARYAA